MKSQPYIDPHQAVQMPEILISARVYRPFDPKGNKGHTQVSCCIFSQCFLIGDRSENISWG